VRRACLVIADFFGAKPNPIFFIRRNKINWSSCIIPNAELLNGVRGLSVALVVISNPMTAHLHLFHLIFLRADFRLIGGGCTHYRRKKRKPPKSEVGLLVSGWSPSGYSSPRNDEISISNFYHKPTTNHYTTSTTTTINTILPRLARCKSA
jgi:hypothetical protein